MTHRFWAAAIAVVLLASPCLAAQSDDAERSATREKLRALLTEIGPTSRINIVFTQNEQQPFNFSGFLKGGLDNVESFDVVVGVTNNQTISLSAFPIYKGNYINVDKVKNTTGLMRQLTHFSHANFMYWGADDTGDIHAGFRFTLESGFPADAIDVVLQSIKLQDKYVGEMRPNIDGTKPR